MRPAWYSSDISVRRPLSGETVARRCSLPPRCPVSVCTSSARVKSPNVNKALNYMWTVFLCGRTVRARSTWRHRAQPPGPATPVPAAPPLPAAHSYLQTTCVRACVRAPASPAQRSVASELSQVSHVYLSAAARECLSPACASVVHMCDSVCGEIATTSSSGVPKVSSLPWESRRSIVVVVVVSSPEEKTCADVDVHVCKQRGTII